MRMKNFQNSDKLTIDLSSERNPWLKFYQNICKPTNNIRQCQMGGRVVYLNWYIACQICWNTTLRVAWLIASNLNQQKFPTFTFLSFNEIDPPSTNICPAVFWLDLVITSAGNIVFSVWHVSGQSVSWPGSTRLPAVAIENGCVQRIFLGFILCTVNRPN